MSVRLLFDGDVELNSDISEDDGYQFQVLASSRRGSPVPVEVVLSSFLRDGAIVDHDRDENIELPLQVKVTAPDSLSLNLGEKRLALATKKRTTLVWSSPDGIAPDTVFEVMTSSLSQPQDEGWDLAELRNQRTYGLRLVCLPHSHSATPTTYSGTTAPDDPGTVVYAFESTAGWSKWVYMGGAAAAVDTATFIQGTGSIRVEAGVGSDTATTSYGEQFSWGNNTDQVTGLSISTGTGGYFGVSIRTDFTDTVYDNYGKALPSGLEQLWVQYSGSATWHEVTFTPSEIEGGFVRNVFPVDDGLTITGLRFLVRQQRLGWGHGTPDVYYDNGTLSTTATTDSSILQTFDLGGSARGPGSLHIAAPDDSVALGQVLVATVAESEVLPGFRIDGRRHVVSGTTTVDATALHGSYYMASDPVFEVPVSILNPGAYSIVALCASGANPLAIGVTSQLVAGGVAVGPTSEASVSVPSVDSDWRFVVVGTVYLPSLPMQNASPADLVRVEFTGGANLADWYMIPAAADYSIADCGDGTVSPSGASSHLWIDSPAPSQPRGGWWRGPLDGRLSARSAWPDVKKAGRHIFAPGRCNVYLVTTDAQGPSITLDRFDWWFGNAAS